MKEHGTESQEAPVKALKSLLKKPGQTKAKGQKNRVVINEKLNEFFAADYIILIKEECCAEYEEECDCCCQEHEMIRLGNCKECRAELNLRFGVDDNNDSIDPRRGVFGCDESQGEEEEDDEDDVDDDEDDDEDEEICRQDRRTPTQLRTHQQRDTLSPPEGYKDLCIAQEQELDAEDPADPRNVCAECDYYQRAATAMTEPQQNCIDTGGAAQEDQKNVQEAVRNISEDGVQPTIDQAQQTTPDVTQRYLVETITMTTVTERRIVREISEEETQSKMIDEIDSTEKKPAIEFKNSDSTEDGSSDKKVESNLDESDPTIKNPEKRLEKIPSKETTDTNPELSLTFKLGNSLSANSLKPNSAVRQLFPDPRFISPPPAPTKSLSCDADDLPEDVNDAQKFLITTESLRLFDNVKNRTKIAGNRSDSSESDSSVKRSIERNALRRSLISKFEPGSKKKNLRSKDLSLEERIRQLTCVDEDEDTADSSASENNNRTIEGCDQKDLQVRTSPSGEERPKTLPVASRSNSVCEQETVVVSSQTSHHHHHHSHSTFRKITDLFAQKKNTAELNLPDIGLGNKQNLGKEFNSKTSLTKMNSEARKQFLATLAPLSCVASTGVDNRENYYRVASKMTIGGNRDSIGYNSDSSYSLDDVDNNHYSEERNHKNSSAPPDVTRGTPTSIGPDNADSVTDELLAFVEQDKSRTERIKRRYDVDDRQNESGHETEEEAKPNKSASMNEEEDDELNDYGFNRRPSVRGIKPQFGTTNEIVRQLRTRSAAANSLPEACRLGLPGPWFYENNTEHQKQETFVDNDGSDVYRVTSVAYSNETHGTDTNTINRINTMQKQIDDIYQTIAESTSISLQGNLDRSSYLESTLPRALVHGPEACHRIPEQKNGLHFPEHQRMLRIAGGDGSNPMYNTLPAKSSRNPAIGYANYHGVIPAANAKCYRTMYLVPYNGISDPTYQNIQKILPPHASPNYATHIERYPYPRNGSVEDPPRYFVRSTGVPMNPAVPLQHAQVASNPALHLHLHEAEDFPVGPRVHPMHLQHHHQQMTSYTVQTVPSYPVAAPTRTATAATAAYTYQLQMQGRTATDVQTQTVSMQQQIQPVLPNNANPHLLAAYSNTPAVIGTASLTTSSSSLLSSPTKVLQVQRNVCMAAERGVPEGAASAPANDFSQAAATTAANSTTNNAMTNSFNANNVPPANAQNSVYYAMNV